MNMIFLKPIILFSVSVVFLDRTNQLSATEISRSGDENLSRSARKLAAWTKSYDSCGTRFRALSTAIEKDEVMARSEGRVGTTYELLRKFGAITPIQKFLESPMGTIILEMNQRSLGMFLEAIVETRLYRTHLATASRKGELSGREAEGIMSILAGVADKINYMDGFSSLVHPARGILPPEYNPPKETKKNLLDYLTEVNRCLSGVNRFLTLAAERNPQIDRGKTFRSIKGYCARHCLAI